MSKTENIHKITVRLSPLTEFRLGRDYRLDGSRSKNEFIALQCEINDYYLVQERKRPPLAGQKEFRAIKNAAVQEAENIRAHVFTFVSASDKMQENAEEKM